MLQKVAQKWHEIDLGNWLHTNLHNDRSLNTQNHAPTTDSATWRTRDCGRHKRSDALSKEPAPAAASSKQHLLPRKSSLLFSSSSCIQAGLPLHTTQRPKPISAEIYMFPKLFLHETPRKKTSKQSSVDTQTNANFKRKRETHTQTHTHGHAEAIRERSSATEEETMMFAQAQMRETRNRKSAHRQKRRRRRCQNPSPPDKPTKQGQSVNQHAPSGPSRMDRWMVSGHETVFCWVPVP
jgi:hypothetical protein